MTPLALIIVLVVIGVGVGFIPMDSRIRTIIVAIVAVVAFVVLIRWLVPGAL